MPLRMDNTPSSTSRPNSTTSATNTDFRRKHTPASLPPKALDLATRLFNAARTGDLPIFEQAIPAGLPVNLTNDKGDTLIMLSAYHTHPALVSYLLLKGADPNTLNDRGQSPLAGAVFKAAGVTRQERGHGRGAEGENGEEEMSDADRVVGLLLDAGAHVDAGRPSAKESVEMFGVERWRGKICGDIYPTSTMGCTHSKEPPFDHVAWHAMDDARLAAEPSIELNQNTINIRDPELRKTLKKTVVVTQGKGLGTPEVRVIVPMGDLVLPLEMFERAEAATAMEELSSIHQEAYAFQKWANLEWKKRARAMALEAEIDPLDAMVPVDKPSKWDPEPGAILTYSTQARYLPPGVERYQPLKLPTVPLALNNVASSGELKKVIGIPIKVHKLDQFHQVMRRAVLVWVVDMVKGQIARAALVSIRVQPSFVAVAGAISQGAISMPKANDRIAPWNI
ncbi:MAG: hypothetical protein Q9170_006147 [Blastenia crenularia]